MPHHHHVGILVDELTVRVKLHLIQLDAALFDDGQTDMRIRFGVAVAREMLDGGDDAAILHTVHVKSGFPAHFIAIFTERAAVNHRVTAVVVDVDARGEVEVDTHGFALLRHFQTHLVNQ